ncbi:MAG: A/G-specific adenine glycosylase [Chthoniobacterales bacterium]
MKPLEVSPETRTAFRRQLLIWYRQHGRDLPWRRTHDAYAILVSEIMLQQTQVATVLPYYNVWLRRFPDFAALARASESDVLHAWQGLGYYARARNLHAAAKAIVKEHDSRFPGDADQARALPGLGRYTANAVATFAFDHAVPIVDANIARVLARLLNLQLPIDTTAGSDAVWSLATSLVPKTRARDFNSALMDLGATVCTPRQPQCPLCPVRSFCLATDPEALPRKKARTALKRLVEYHGLVRRHGDVLLEQSQKRWRGMWILPQLAGPPEDVAAIFAATFPFTHHRITLEVFDVPKHRTKSTHRWFSISDLAAIPVPSPHRRALDALLPN